MTIPSHIQRVPENVPLRSASTSSPLKNSQLVFAPQASGGSITAFADACRHEGVMIDEINPTSEITPEQYLDFIRQQINQSNLPDDRKQALLDQGENIHVSVHCTSAGMNDDIINQLPLGKFKEIKFVIKDPMQTTLSRIAKDKKARELLDGDLELYALPLLKQVRPNDVDASWTTQSQEWKDYCAQNPTIIQGQAALITQYKQSEMEQFTQVMKSEAYYAVALNELNAINQIIEKCVEEELSYSVHDMTFPAQGDFPLEDGMKLSEDVPQLEFTKPKPLVVALDDENDAGLYERFLNIAKRALTSDAIQLRKPLSKKKQKESARRLEEYVGKKGFKSVEEAYEMYAILKRKYVTSSSEDAKPAANPSSKKGKKKRK